MKWNRLESLEPQFLTRKQGRKKGARVVIGGVSWDIRRVVSPTVAWATLTPPIVAWAMDKESTDMPFLNLLPWDIED